MTADRLRVRRKADISMSIRVGFCSNAKRARVLVRWFSITLAAIAFVGALGGIALAGDAACSFQTGQKWQVKSGDGANVVIGRVEDWRADKVVHVSIKQIRIPAGLPNAGTEIEISHAPFSCASLQGSVGELISSANAPSPGFEDGYQQWRDTKGAGVFTIGVNEVIALLLKQKSGN